MPPASWSITPPSIRSNPKRQIDQSLKTLSELCQKHKVELISIGNGTASRETDRLVSDFCSSATPPPRLRR